MKRLLLTTLAALALLVLPVRADDTLSVPLNSTSSVTILPFAYTNFLKIVSAYTNTYFDPLALSNVNQIVKQSTNTTPVVTASAVRQVNTLWILVSNPCYFSPTNPATSTCGIIPSGYTLSWEYPINPPAMPSFLAVTGLATAQVWRTTR